MDPFTISPKTKSTASSMSFLRLIPVVLLCSCATPKDKAPAPILIEKGEVTKLEWPKVQYE
jgi:hypothetical protein